MNFKAFMNTVTSHARALPIVILYVTEGCNLKCITCSYRQPAPNELTLDEIKQLAQSLVHFGLRHIVFSGGEPLLRRDFPQICRVFKALGVKQTLLTNGVLLEKRLNELGGLFTEIIVSIDGPDEQTHNAIRGIPSFNQIVKGVRSATQSKDCGQISIRTVVQKKNFCRMMDMVEFAKSLNVNRISFLAADVLSESFGRDTSGSIAANDAIVLSEDEAVEFRRIVEETILKYKDDIDARFISESSQKLLHLVQYFEALLGTASFPKNHCNAPMMSAVITSTGNVQPCYFLPEYGNIREIPLTALANNPHITTVRDDVRDYKLERCQTCVCTLHVQPHMALFGKF